MNFFKREQDEGLMIKRKLYIAYLFFTLCFAENLYARRIKASFYETAEKCCKIFTEKKPVLWSQKVLLGVTGLLVVWVGFKFYIKTQEAKTTKKNMISLQRRNRMLAFRNRFLEKKVQGFMRDLQEAREESKLFKKYKNLYCEARRDANFLTEHYNALVSRNEKWRQKRQAYKDEKKRLEQKIEFLIEEKACSLNKKDLSYLVLESVKKALHEEQGKKILNFFYFVKEIFPSYLKSDKSEKDKSKNDVDD